MVQPKKLQRTAPIFQANTHQNMGQSFAIFLGEPLFQLFSYKKWTLVHYIQNPLISDVEDQECLWIIEAPNQEKIQISWGSSHSDCPATSNHVFAYDGLPPFVSHSFGQSLGVFCLGSHSMTQTTKVRLYFI